MAIEIFDSFGPQTQAEVDKIMESHRSELARVAGQRVRAVRVVIFEGEGQGVMDQIARSSVPGTRSLKWGTLTIIQGPVEVVEEPAEGAEVVIEVPDGA